MGNKKIRVNILDFLIVAMVILCIAGAVLRGYVEKRDAKLDTKEVVVEFRISDIQTASIAAFIPGSAVYNEDFDCSMGEIYKMSPSHPAKYIPSAIKAVWISLTAQMEEWMSRELFCVAGRGLKRAALSLTEHSILHRVKWQRSRFLRLREIFS